jgi:hypothetical protein
MDHEWWRQATGLGVIGGTQEAGATPESTMATGSVL